MRKTDEAVKQALSGICERIEASDGLKRQIDSRIENRLVKEAHHMKHLSIKKVVIGVAAACLVVGTVCIAGSGMKMYSSGGSSIPDYTKYEDLGKAEKEAGYEIQAVDQFGNGYALDGIHVNDMSIQNEAGQTEDSEKEIIIKYTKGGETIRLFARKILPMEDETELIKNTDSGKTVKAGETELVFSQVTNKFVPPDYELTEEDKKNMERDDFNLAYGSSEVEMDQSYHVSWIKDGIIYSIMGFNLSNVTPDEMLDMAKEIVESGK